MTTTSGINKHDLSVTLSVLVRGNDPAKVEELMKENLQKLQGNIGLPGLVSMLKSMSSMSFKSACVPSLKIFSAAVLREAVAVSQQKPLHSPDLSVIVGAAKKDRKALKRLLVIAASPALLASVQNIRIDSPWKQANALISGLLGPFVKARAEVPRLEATCAARLMEMLGRVCNISDVCGFAALLLHFRAHSLLAMPSFLDVFAAKLGIVVSSPASSSDTGVVCRLCLKLLAVVNKKAPPSSGDIELDKWVKGLEALAVDQFQSREHDSIYERLEKAVIDKFGKGVKGALGTGWLNTLLVRCKKIVWLGGKNIRCDTPNPVSSVKSFAQAVYPLLGTAARAKVDKLDLEEEDQPAETSVFEKRASSISAEEESPKKKPRTQSSMKANSKEQTPQKKSTLVVKVGEDKQMGETLVGTYVISGANHERNVYSRTEGEPVLLFYWDDRDGEDQAGWWFGPEVGGEEVWAYHCDSTVEPPELGWTMLYSGELDPTFKVEALRETGGPDKHAAPQEDGLNSQHESCKVWLKDLDGGAGELLVYFDVLVAEFDADLSQIAAAKIEGKHADVLDYVDPSFWETLAVDNLAHKKLFAEGMKNL